MSMSAKDLLAPISEGTVIEAASTPVAQPEKLTERTIGGLRIAKPTTTGFINMLIYGFSGVGKTRLSGSSVKVPDLSPVLFWDFEGGTLSLASDYGECDVARLTSWKAVDKLYGDLYNRNPYKTLVVDSLTETHKFSMGEVMRDVVLKNSERDLDVASLREWGKVGEQIRRLVRALRDLPCNTIFTCLAKDETNDSGAVIKTHPALPGQLKGEIAGYVDIVGYLYKKEVRLAGNTEVKTLLLTQGTERQIAKDRSGRLPALIESPTMQDIYDYIRGEKTK
jgi:hypothetical protein